MTSEPTLAPRNMAHDPPHFFLSLICTTSPQVRVESSWEHKCIIHHSYSLSSAQPSSSTVSGGEKANPLRLPSSNKDFSLNGNERLKGQPEAARSKGDNVKRDDFDRYTSRHAPNTAPIQISPKWSTWVPSCDAR